MNDQTLQLQEEVQLGGMLVQGGDDGGGQQRTACPLIRTERAQTVTLL